MSAREQRSRAAHQHRYGICYAKSGSRATPSEKQAMTLSIVRAREQAPLSLKGWLVLAGSVQDGMKNFSQLCQPRRSNLSALV